VSFARAAEFAQLRVMDVAFSAKEGVADLRCAASLGKPFSPGSPM